MVFPVLKAHLMQRSAECEAEFLVKLFADLVSGGYHRYNAVERSALFCAVENCAYQRGAGAFPAEVRGDVH